MSPMPATLPSLSNSASLANNSFEKFERKYIELERKYIELERAYGKHYDSILKYLTILKELYDHLQAGNLKKSDLEKISRHIDFKKEIRRIETSIEAKEEAILSHEEDRPQIVRMSRKILAELNTLNALLRETDWLITILTRQQESSTGKTYSVQELIDTL